SSSMVKRCLSAMFLLSAIFAAGRLTRVDFEAQGIGSKFDRAVRDAVDHHSNGLVRVLVHVRSGAAARVHQRLSSAPGIEFVKRSTSPDLLVAELSAATVPLMATDPDVLHVSSDAIVRS